MSSPSINDLFDLLVIVGAFVALLLLAEVLYRAGPYLGRALDALLNALKRRS